MDRHLPDPMTIDPRAWRQGAVSALPAVLAAVALALALLVPFSGWTAAPAASPFGPAGSWLALTFLAVLALGSLHRPLGGSGLGLGAAALPPAIALFGGAWAAGLAAAGYVLGGVGRRLLARLSPAPPDERRGIARLVEGAGRAALATLAAALAAHALAAGGAEVAPRAGAFAWAPVAGSGLAYLATFFALVLGAAKLRRPRQALHPLHRAVSLALDAAGWGLGGLLAAVASLAGSAGQGLAAALLWAFALLAFEAARLGVLQGAFERRAVDLERVTRASRRMGAAGFGLGGLAAQIRAECLRVLDVQWFQLTLSEEGGSVRSWWAGPDGAIHGGVPDPGPWAPALPGIHRRRPWELVERDLEADDRALGRIRLWCDPRRARPADVALLESLLPQLSGWTHRAILDREAREDPLTGVPVRRLLERSLAELFGRCCQQGGAVSVIMCDLDRFKEINDTYGHPAGDRALVAVAKTLDAHRRAADTCARYGGEEFALVLGDTDGEGALAVAERLRQAVEALLVEDRAQPIRLTVSLGVASFPELWAAAPGELLALADEALYEAKRRGRNRCLLNLGRGRFRGASGEVVGGDGEGGPVEAPRIFA